LTEAAALGVPLVLSGHTHGGQVVLPVVGAVAARKFPVVAGTARLERTTLFVSRGIGTVYVPVRINCPPEVAVVDAPSRGGRMNRRPCSSQPSLEHEPYRLRVEAMLLDEDSCRQGLDRVGIEHRHGGLKHDWAGYRAPTPRDAP
jgi:hypothetical protein